MTLIDSQEIFDRLPPHNIEAEQCAIGSMILSVTLQELHRVTAVAKREHFYQQDHAILYDVICDLWKTGKCVDAILLREELMSRQLLNEIGGSGYLAQLIGTVPSAAHGEHYAGIVREKAVLRGCISVANDVIREAYAPHCGETATKIAADAVRGLSTLAATGRIEKIVSLEEAVNEVFERKEAGEITRITTGIVELDAQIGGLPVGQFSMIGSRPGMGKSLVLKQVLRNIAARGISVGVITIEESRHKIAENCLSAASGIENHRIAYGNMSTEEWKEVGHGANVICKYPFYIADEPVKLDEVETSITMLVVEKKCQVIAIDYLQLISADEQNENREITMISRAVKAAFKRLNVAGLVAIQLNRGNEHGETRWPVLKDLRGSGSLEQDGDLIMLLHSDDYYRRQKGDSYRDNKLMILVRKNKSGPNADVPVFLSAKTQEIREWIAPTPFDSEAA